MRKQNFISLAVMTEWMWNFRSLAVKAERKCGSGLSGLWQSKQSKSSESELQILSSQDRAVVRKQNFRFFGSPVKLELRKQNLTSLTGPYASDCHWQCWEITLVTAINNSTDCYNEGQYKDHVWLKHRTFTVLVTRSLCSCWGFG